MAISANNAQCGFASIPIDRADVSKGMVKLPIVIIKSKAQTSKPPVFFLHGGPGGHVIADLPEMLGSDFGRTILNSDRDWIFFDQRGSGKSIPSLDCEAVTLNDAGPASSTMGALKSCIDNHSKSVDLAKFDSENIALDLIDISDILKIEKFSIFGYSYGSRIAIQAARNFENRIEAMVLDSYWPPNASWTANGPKWVQDALDQLERKCQSNKACNYKYPQFSMDIEKLMSQKAKTNDGAHFNQALAQFIMDALYVADDAKILPQNLNEIANGNSEKLRPYLEGKSGSYWEAAHLAILCNEEFPFETEAEMITNSKSSEIAKAVAKSMSNYFAACKFIKAKQKSPTDNLNPKIKIPILILSAEIDPGCPSYLARDATEYLPKSSQIIFANSFHGLFENSNCALRIINDFLEDPSSTIQNECSKTEKPVVSFTTETGGKNDN